MLVVPVSTVPTPSRDHAVRSMSYAPVHVLGVKDTPQKLSTSDAQRLSQNIDAMQLVQLKIEKMYGAGVGTSVLDRQKSIEELDNFAKRSPSAVEDKGQYLRNYFSMHGY